MAKPIDRTGAGFDIHNHVCPECGRTFTCGCEAQKTKNDLQCRDCEQKGQK